MEFALERRSAVPCQTALGVTPREEVERGPPTPSQLIVFQVHWVQLSHCFQKTIATGPVALKHHGAEELGVTILGKTVFPPCSLALSYGSVVCLLYAQDRTGSDRKHVWVI